MQRWPDPASRSSRALAIVGELWRRGSAVARRTPGLLLLSLLLGGALWVFVTDTENPTRTDVFPVLIPVDEVNVAQGVAVANTLPFVQVRISASEDRWERLSSVNLHAFVDLNGLEAREHEVAVHVDVEGISGVRVVGTTPASVIVELEELVSRPVPVVVRLVGVGEVPRGYELGEARPERDTVEVAGPASLVALVRQAVAEVEVGGLTVALERAVDLTPRDEAGVQVRGVQLDPPSLRVVVDVTQTTITRTLPLVAVISGQPAPGYRVTGVEVSPATATVQGTIEALRELEALTLTPVEIDGARDGAVTETVALQPVAGVSATERLFATVVVSVAPVVGSLQLSIVPEAGGVAEGLVARFEVETVTVLLEGPLVALNDITPAGVRATVDAAGLGAGAVELAVEVQAPAGVSRATVQPQTLSVTLEVPR